MNHREEPPHLPAGARRALYATALLLVPALGLEQGHAGPRQGSLYPRAAEPTPYLPVIGFSALRFAAAPPPPDLVTRPASVGPPVPAASPIEATVAAANVTAAQRAPALAKPEPAAALDGASASNETATGKPPAPILPDTAHPIVHAEDFLPYFEIPGSAHQPADVTLIAPLGPTAPNAPVAPPSSATYTQTPR